MNMKIEANLVCEAKGKTEILKEDIDVQVCSSFVPQNVYFVTFGYVEDLQKEKHRDEKYYKVQNIINAQYSYEGITLSLVLLQMIVDNYLITYVHENGCYNLFGYWVESYLPYSEFICYDENFLIDIDEIESEKKITDILKEYIRFAELEEEMQNKAMK